MKRIALAVVVAAGMVLPAIAFAAPGDTFATPGNMDAAYGTTAAPTDTLDDQGPAAHRETTALNMLQAHGFGDYQSFHAVGWNFEAQAFQDGQPVTVFVNPDTGDVHIVS